jgi:hypothetical protein
MLEDPLGFTLNSATAPVDPLSNTVFVAALTSNSGVPTVTIEILEVAFVA